MDRKRSNVLLYPDDLEVLYGYKANDFIYNYLEMFQIVKKQFGEVLRPKGQITEQKCLWFIIDDDRKQCFYKEPGKGIHLRKEHLLLDEFEFLVIISLLSLPHGYFRGNAYQLLSYMGYTKIKKSTIQKLIKALKVLQDNKYITTEIEQEERSYYRLYNLFIKKYINVDDGDLWLPFAAAKQMREFIDVSTMQEGSYFKLLKVWVSMQNQPYEEKFGYFEIQRDTGLTKNQVINMVKWLKQMQVLEDIVKVGSAFKRKADGSVLQLEQKL